MIDRRKFMIGTVAAGLVPSTAACSTPLPDTTMLRIPSDFFGMHINALSSDPLFGHRRTPWHDLNFDWVRIWDTFTTWKLINTANGVYDWHRLDEVVAVAGERHGKKLLLNLGCAPDWATGLSIEKSQYSPGVPTDASWIAWIKAVVTRYRGVIAAYELWNEPPDKLFWSGTVEQLAHLCALAYPIIKSIDPAAVVLSPCPYGSGAAAYLDKMLSAGMGESCDALSIHTYVRSAQPEEIIPYTQRCMQVARAHGYTRKPLWSTECGWITYTNSSGRTINTKTSADMMPTDMATSYIARMMFATASVGLARSFYYSMDNDDYLVKIAMLDHATKSTIEPAGKAFSYIANLIQGGRLGKITNKSTMLQTAVFQINGITADGVKYSALWSEDFHQSIIDISGMNASSATNCTGSNIDISNRSISINMLPIIVFHS